jgi:DNA repair protein RecO (recombination protein O)
MPPLSDQAICLRLRDWSETSQVAVLLTRTHGKLAVVAKGAKRRTPSAMSRFSGGLELLSRAQAIIYPKSAAALANLAEWDLLDAHWHLRSDLTAYRLGMYAADLTDHLLIDADPHPPVFDALARLFGGLCGTDGYLALLQFQWASVVDLGYEPVLDRDAQGAGPATAAGPTVAFSVSAGGLVEDPGPADHWRVRRSTIALLRQLRAGQPIDDADARVVIRANRLLCAYFRAILDRHLPTMDLLLKR